MNNLEKRIKEIFPKENIKVLNFSTMKNPASIQCLNCNQIYNLKRAENFVRKNKKYICKKCAKKNNLTIQDFQKIINKKYPKEHLKVLTYTSKNEPCSIKCLRCNNIYKLQNAQSFLNVEKNRVCKNCLPNKIEQMENSIKKFKNYIANQPFELITDLNNTKINSKTLIECKCKYCGKLNKKTIYDYLKGKGCTCQSNNVLLTSEEYQQELGQEYSLLNSYRGREHSVLIRHNLCGFCYKTNARHFTCPKCRGSKGEKTIAFLLKQKNIDFIREYRVNIQKHNLRFDFFIPSLNLFIEFQGQQHFKANNYFGGEEGLKRQQLYDDYKRQWCKKNNYQLLEIKYNDNIETKLFNYLLKFNDHPEKE